MHACEQRSGIILGRPPLAGVLLAAGVIVAAFAAQVLPGLAEAWQWERDSGFGFLWSWITSHLSHWSWNHLLWDVLVFGFFSWLSLRLMPERYVNCLFVASLLIPLEVAINQPLLESYRGLSGLDCALFGLLVAALWRMRPARKGGWLTPRVLALAGTDGFLAKTVYETWAGATVFVDAGAQAFVPVPSAHLVGFLCGLVMGLARGGDQGAVLHPAGIRSEPHTVPGL